MRRQRRTHQHDSDDDGEYTRATIATTVYQTLSDDSEQFLEMERLSRENRSKYRFENTIEAKVEDGDTLQALALRFHCTVAEIKRLNKIDKENEIHARQVVKIPVTVHSVLWDAMPTVHTSGSNSPKVGEGNDNGEGDATSRIVRNPLEPVTLSEKLMIASVNASGTNLTTAARIRTTDGETVHQGSGDSVPLINDILVDDDDHYIRPIPGPSSFNAFDWSGSDCDISWICLFFVILALCIIIPLVVVIWMTEHPHRHNASLI